MTKLRNIGYLRFGSKILQSFAGFFYLPHPSSLPPALWMSWESNEGGGEIEAFYTVRGSLPPPAGRQAPAAQWRGGKGRASVQIKIIFIYI